MAGLTYTALLTQDRIYWFEWRFLEHSRYSLDLAQVAISCFVPWKLTLAQIFGNKWSLTLGTHVAWAFCMGGRSGRGSQGSNLSRGSLSNEFNWSPLKFQKYKILQRQIKKLGMVAKDV